MTPLANPTTPGEESYNRRHTGTRVIVEQCFGVLKSRFRCLHKSGGALQYLPVKCAKITIACLLLHNYCVQLRIPVPAEDIEVEERMIEDPPHPAAVHSGRGVANRNALVTQFSH